MFRLAAWRRPAALGAGRLTVQMRGPSHARLSYRGDDGIERERCLRRQLWVLRVVTSTGASRATLREVRCLAAGDAACEYLVSWRSRARTLAVVGTGVIVAVVLAGGIAGGAPVVWVAALVASVAAYGVERWRAARTDALVRAQSGAAFRQWATDAFASCDEPVAASEATGVAVELDGDLWRVTYQGTTIRLRHSRGLALLAHLVRSPGQDIHVATLDAITPSNRPGAVRGPASESLATSGGRGDAGEILDAQARAEYRRRADELREELAEAEARHDAHRVEAMRDELEQLEEELRLALGAGGRPRRAANDAERLRVAITHRIRAAIDQIARRHAALGEHLRMTVSTGYRCVYDPTGARIVEDRVARQPERLV